MGFWEKIFGKRSEIEGEIVENKTATLNIDDIEKQLLVKKAEETSDFIKAVKPKYEEIKNMSVLLLESLVKLENAKTNEEIDNDMTNQRIMSAAIASRKSFIKKMKDLVGEIKSGMSLDLNSIIDFRKTITETLENTDKYTERDYAICSNVFKKESYDVLNIFKKLHNTITNFRNAVDSKKSSVDLIDQCLMRIHDLEVNIEDFEKAKLHANGILKKIEGNIQVKTDIENKLGGLNNSYEMKEFRSLSEDMDSITRQISDKSNEILNLVSPLEKANRKVMKMIGDGTLVFENGRYIDSFLENPVLTVSENTETFNTMLNFLERCLLDKKLDLKDREKTLQKINELTAGKRIDEIVKEFKGLEDRKKYLQDRFSNVRIIEDVNKLNGQLNDIERGSLELNKELSASRLLIEKMGRSVVYGKEELEKSSANIIGYDIKINI
ncbi:MAG TPA: hypothetical protein VJH34_00470 [archaeon]|nr:hypothetical protein [archaeon]